MRALLVMLLSATAGCGGGDDCLAGASAFASVAAERAGACTGAAGGGAPAILPPVVTYEVTGSAAQAHLTFESEQGATVQVTASVPWTLRFHGTQDQWLYIGAQNATETGDIRARLLIDGALKVDETSSRPFGAIGDGVFCCD